MKRIALLILSALLFVSCRTLPAINSALPQAAQKSLTCPSPFLKEPYRLVHGIETRMAGDTAGAIIGITVADPATRFVSCAIMTAEGMVLFEADAQAVLKVKRALPPFDSNDFAQNMINDIKLIFFAPEGKIKARGILADGARVCRYQEENGEWIDVAERQPEGIEIKKYSSYGNLKRQIKLNRTAENPYQNIELQAKELFDYSLLMTLIEAEPLEGELKTEKAKGDEE
jgi:hypothetical protein